MSLVCAVPSFTDLTAVTGEEVIVVSGHSATRLRLDKVLPVQRAGKLFFRALLSGPEGSEVRDGTHLSRVGDYLVRLRLNRVLSEDGSEHYEAHAQAHVDQMEQFDRFESYHLAAV
jgi:hypothetical protein